MADNTRPRNVSMRCSDSIELIVDEPVAKQSQFLKQIIEQPHNVNNPIIYIQVPFVTSEILSKVLKYCAKHATASASTTTAAAGGEDRGGGAAGELRRWDEEYARSLESDPDIDTQLSVLVAAANLDIKSLIDLLCKELPEVPEDKPVE